MGVSCECSIGADECDVGDFIHARSTQIFFLKVRGERDLLSQIVQVVVQPEMRITWARPGSLAGDLQVLRHQLAGAWFALGRGVCGGCGHGSASLFQAQIFAPWHLVAVDVEAPVLHEFPGEKQGVDAAVTDAGNAVIVASVNGAGVASLHDAGG